LGEWVFAQSDLKPLDYAMKSIWLLMKALGVVFLFGVLAVAWAMWNINRPPFDLARLQQLRPGMSQQEVRKILGAPKSDYGDHWAYARFMAWPIVYIRFDESNRFRASEYDY
jgi:hypothetical protein